MTACALDFLRITRCALCFLCLDALLALVHLHALVHHAPSAFCTNATFCFAFTYTTNYANKWFLRLTLSFLRPGLPKRANWVVIPHRSMWWVMAF